ncbi:hypothetical protein DPV78_011518 [Talaromyces pinophilus]|nr:hypothetical protein DPV78_011518 [Talaromyces pinophilus]
MSIVSNYSNSKISNPLFESPTFSIATRAVGDRSDPWLRTASRVAAGVGIGLSTSLLIMRVYTKARIMRKFWWDDTFMIVAWVFSVTSQSVILYGYSYAGIGEHLENLNQAELAKYPKTMLAASTIYFLCLAFAKLAILMFYYALLNVMQFWKYVIYVVSGIIVAYTLAIFLALIFACHPVERNWDAIPPFWEIDHCIDRAGLYLATAITNTMSDIILILIPIPIIWKLHVTVRQKLGIAAILGVGCMTVIISIVRLATIYPLVTSNDQPYEMALASILIIIECDFAIICGCLPYLRQFLRRYAPRLLGDGNTSSSSETRDQAKEVILRPIRAHTTTSDAPEQSQEIPRTTPEDPQYSYCPSPPHD